ncbi:MAG: hypothetical protein QXM53_08150 [Thermofilaceae archaeon]
MGWFTSREKLDTWARLLLVISCVASVAIAVLYVLLSTTPILRFSGYVEGYYSLYNYRLSYTHNGQLIHMPHTDYVRHVAVVFSTASCTLAGVALIAIAIARRKPLIAPGIAYGVSTALIVLYGLLRGYMWRAIELDISRFNHLIGDTLTYRTLAGTITFEGIKVEQTIIYRVAHLSSIPIILLTLAVIPSAIATGIAIYTFYRNNTQTEKPSEKTPVNKLKKVTAYATTGLTTFALLASVFTYYPSSVTVNPQPPPATLEQPLYTYTCTGLLRTSRRALTYTDFEAYPVPGWTSYGGVWELSAGGGFKGNALRGRDNDGGVGRSSQYYWNTRIDGYTSLWVSVKVRAETFDGYKGIGLLNADRSRLYEISVQSTATIHKWDGAWRLIGSTSVPGYSATRWYTLVLNYSVTATAVSFTLWIYDDTGALVATLTASDTGATRFTPAYAGVTIDAVPPRWFRFDDFIVSTMDPRSLHFTGFYTGMRVEVWDNLGYLVNSTAAPAPSFTLGVVSDVVVGTGSDGRIVVRYPDAYLCGVLTVPSTDAILGGDAYTLSTAPITVVLGVNKTSASLALRISGDPWFTTEARVLWVNVFQLLYARLLLDSLSAPSTLNLDLWIEGAATSTRIEIRNGNPISTSTSIVQLNLGLGNTIHLRGNFTTVNQVATLSLKLEICTMPGSMGACVFYPITLDLTSSP